MEYLSALGPLLILMLFGGGFVIAAYLTFDDMRSRGGSFDAASFVTAIRSTVDRVRALPTTTLIMIGAVVVAALFVYLVSASGYYARPAVETSATPAAVETAATPAPEAAAPAPAAKTAPAPAPATKAPAADKQAAAAAPAAIAAVRNVTSTSCASDGCPVTCAANETLTSAYCVNGGAAKLADQLTVKDGSVTAKCSPSASAIKVACARK
jgi:nucleoid-associated protein YgaU